MRRIVFVLTALTAFAIAGCDQNGSQQDQTQKAAQQVTSVSGTISLKQPRSLTPKATLQIKLVDASTQSTTPLVSKTIAPVKAMPVHFSLDFSPADINQNDLYVVQAELVDGERLYSMPLQAPVLTKGAGHTLNISLVAKATAGEKLMAEFKKVQAHIGGMTMSHGTSLSKDVSRGWQTFRDRQTDEVAFVRELADYGDKGFTRTDYAYKDGKPWVIEQIKKPSQNAPATETDRAGWDMDNKLVLKDKVVGSKTSTLSDADAATLKQQATAMFEQVDKGHKPKPNKGKM